MAAKTMVLNLYGAVGDSIEKIVSERLMTWKMSAPSSKWSKDEASRVLNARAYESKADAKALEDEISSKKIKAMMDHKSSKPTRVAVVYELLEKGIAAEAVARKKPAPRSIKNP
jgi:hypothetical protein